MTTDGQIRERDPMLYTAQIVAGYLQGNQVDATDIASVVETVHQTVKVLCSESLPPSGQRPAVPVEKSITPDHIICLEDGKKFKMLKKHLMTHYGMTPEQYRSKWGLPVDYPMVAPNYAAKRQELAKASGLGKSR
ncbi:MAG: MucR family transcriptional regulator [Pseudomonadota bacterium]